MDLRPLINPTGEAFQEISRRIFHERTDLQKAYGNVEDPGYQKWLAIHGGLEYPDQLAGLYPPVPPAELRATACGGPTKQTHLYTSLEDFLVIVGLWETYAQRPITELQSVLDFGSGCGRLLRRFPMGLPRVACHGADVRAASIDWCQANLPGTYIHNGTTPPLDLPAGSMDLVVSLSVFSHLRRESNLAWIAELTRLLKPDGLMMVTTHGAFALHVIRQSTEHQDTLGVNADQARDYLRTLQEQRFIYHPIPKEMARDLDGVEEDYGQVFFNEQFVREDWAPYVRIAGYIPASLDLFQDFYVLKRVKA